MAEVSKKLKRNTALAKRIGAADLTQLELARLAGVSHYTVTRVLKGYGCHAKTASAIAAALGCEPEACGFFLDSVES